MYQVSTVNRAGLPVTTRQRSPLRQIESPYREEMESIMPLSSLPPDVLRLIFGHLSPSDLKQISETCRALYAAATTEEQFSLRVPELHKEKGVQEWSVAYRRFRALRRGPRRIRPVGRTSSEGRQRKLIGSAGKHYLVVYDDVSGILAGFPNGWALHIGREMAARCIMVGAACVAIVHGTGNCASAIERIDAETGRRVSIASINETEDVIACSKFCTRRIRREQVAMSAGADGDHLVFVCQDSLVVHVVVVRMADGHVFRRTSVEGNAFAALVRGVDGGWWAGDGDGGSRVVGLLQSEGREYVVTNILSGDEIARVDVGTPDMVDIMVTETELGVRRAVRIGGDRAVIYVTNVYPRTETRCDIGSASDAFRTASCEFSIARGGREVRILPMGCARVGESEPDGRICRVWYDDDCVRIDTLNGMRRVLGVAFDWGSISNDGSIALAGCMSVGIFSVFELDSGRCVVSVQCEEPLVDIALVGQHWVVAIGTSGRAYEWHFSTFCNVDVSPDHKENPRDYGRFSRCEILLSQWNAVFENTTTT